MFRFLRRKLVLCFFLIFAFLALKQLLPGVGREIGQWFSGMGDSRVAEAFSRMCRALGGGEGVSKAVEVFCDGIQGG